MNENKLRSITTSEREGEPSHIHIARPSRIPRRDLPIRLELPSDELPQIEPAAALVMDPAA